MTPEQEKQVLEQLADLRFQVKACAALLQRNIFEQRLQSSLRRELETQIQMTKPEIDAFVADVSPKIAAHMKSEWEDICREIRAERVPESPPTAGDSNGLN